MPTLFRRLTARLVAGVLLLVVFPFTTVLTVVLVDHASDALQSTARTGLAASARTAAARTDAWVAERRADARFLADDLAGIDREDFDVVRDPPEGFELVQLLSLDGERITGSSGAPPLVRPGNPLFAQAAGGERVLAEPVLAGGTIRTLVLEPVTAVGDRGEIEAVLVADLDETRLTRFVADARLGDTGIVNLRDSEGRLIWSSEEGVVDSPREMASRGALHERARTEATQLASTGESGALDYTDARGVEVVGGYAPIPVTDWTVTVKQDRGEAFEATDEQQELAIIIGVIGALVAGILAFLFARRITRPIKALGATAEQVAGGDLRVRATEEGPLEIETLARSFNTMVENLERLAGEIRAAGRELAASSSQLSSASSELAATTSQQTAATAQTSSTMEELAQTSARIAESVESVAGSATDTQGVLQRAEAGLAESSRHTSDLATLASEIGGIVGLVTEIADKTNLLALNAAIEAARAGEAGAGFAVVAEEVRLLAERSKTEAAKIGGIIDRGQEEISATVMATEAGSKEMRHGLELMDGVTDSTNEVRLSTDQQRIATDQVVQAMSSVSGATKQTADTAQQVADSARAITELAARLDEAASSFRTGEEAGPRTGSEGSAPDEG